eukprot:2688736-Pleurochrysis_carterae.AAC.1
MAKVAYVFALTNWAYISSRRESVDRVIKTAICFCRSRDSFQANCPSDQRNLSKRPKSFALPSKLPHTTPLRLLPCRHTFELDRLQPITAFICPLPPSLFLAETSICNREKGPLGSRLAALEPLFRCSTLDLHDVSQSVRLSVLVMAKCALRSLPAEVFALPQLQLLDVGRNLLTSLPQPPQTPSSNVLSIKPSANSAFRQNRFGSGLEMSRMRSRLPEANGRSHGLRAGLVTSAITCAVQQDLASSGLVDVNDPL